MSSLFIRSFRSFVLSLLWLLLSSKMLASGCYSVISRQNKVYVCVYVRSYVRSIFRSCVKSVAALVIISLQFSSLLAAVIVLGIGFVLFVLLSSQRVLNYSCETLWELLHHPRSFVRSLVRSHARPTVLSYVYSPHKLAVIFVDNFGADIILGMFLYVRELLSRETKVHLLLKQTVF